MSPASLDTRVLVTGGTSGLGQAMAGALAAAGARVILTGRKRGRAKEAAARLSGDVTGMAMDVRDEGSIADGLEEVYERLGGLDMLVNNAGIGMRSVNPKFMTDPQPFWKVEPDGFRDVVNTKLTGCFLVARAVAPQMLADGGGQIVMISMNQATMTRRGFIPYGPSGAGVEALAEVMTADLADTPVNLNILLPGGATATGMIPDELPDDARTKLLDPAVMAAPIVWLASADARGVHGQRIVAAEFEEWLARRR